MIYWMCPVMTTAVVSVLRDSLPLMCTSGSVVLLITGTARHNLSSVGGREGWTALESGFVLKKRWKTE